MNREDLLIPPDLKSFRFLPLQLSLVSRSIDVAFKPFSVPSFQLQIRFECEHWWIIVCNKSAAKNPRYFIIRREFLHREVFFHEQRGERENSRAGKSTLIGISTSLFSHYSRITFHYFQRRSCDEKLKRRMGCSSCVCITLMIRDRGWVGGRNSRHTLAVQTTSDCSSASIMWARFNGTSHAIHERAISNVFHAFVRQISLWDVEWMEELNRSEQSKLNHDAEMSSNAIESWVA